ncbi:MAG: nucleotidyltransferase domain-containing protein [Anaerolineae bacterium]|nr:MAG: nucleotidyltransferase domain-containing protein [Anaerolineae bacterium]
MYENHRLTIQHLSQHFGTDPNVLVLIIIGSVARGDAGEESDVDFYLVVSDEAYSQGKVNNNLSLELTDLVVPPCPQANGKKITTQYLEAVAKHGTEPYRYSFADAHIAFSRQSSVKEMVQQCSIYPEHQRLDKMMSFVAQIPVHFSFLEFGHYSQTQYVLYETAVKIVLFAGRLILAHNRMLYPGRKGFMRELDKASDKPADMLVLANNLLTTPTIESAQAFIDPVLRYADWPQPPEGIGPRFMYDSVDQWERGWCPLEDC